MEFQTHPVGPEVWFGLTMYPVEDAPQVLRVFRDVMKDAPDELTSLAIYWTAPDEEHIPEKDRGRPTVVLVSCWSGDMSRGEQVLRPLRNAATPVADMSSPMTFLEAQQVFDPEYPDGRRYYWKSLYMNELTDEVVEVLGKAEANRPSMLSSIDVWGIGGAMSRVVCSATSFFRRDAPYLLGVEANWENPDDDVANIAWVRTLIEDVNRIAPAGAYLNFPGFLEEGDDLLSKSFGPNFRRLRQVKQEYDPNDMFCFNVGITGEIGA